MNYLALLTTGKEFHLDEFLGESDDISGYLPGTSADGTETVGYRWYQPKGGLFFIETAYVKQSSMLFVASWKK
jgi:hypothetical protein